MSNADDFLNKLDAYIATCIREHRPGLHAVDLNTRDNSTRADLVKEQYSNFSPSYANGWVMS